MRVVQVNCARDTLRRNGQALLDAWLTLPSVAASVRNAGAQLCADFHPCLVTSRGQLFTKFPEKFPEAGNFSVRIFPSPAHALRGGEPAPHLMRGGAPASGRRPKLRTRGAFDTAAFVPPPPLRGPPPPRVPRGGGNRSRVATPPGVIFQTSLLFSLHQGGSATPLSLRDAVPACARVTAAVSRRVPFFDSSLLFSLHQGR
jgi:hypothetical protein